MMELDDLSLNRLLSLYNVQLRYVSPSNLGMPKDVMDYIGSKGIPQVNSPTTPLKSS